MFAHLLVPLDGSNFGDEAMTYALSLAQKYASQITLLHVTSQQWEAEMSAEVPQAEALTEQTETNIMAANLKAKKDKLAADGYKVEALIMKGQPISDVILKAAETENADTIIITTHGLTGWRRHLFGSVAEKVISQSQIPVLVIRPLAKES